MTAQALSLFAVLNIGDAVTTAAILSQGGQELNPVFAGLDPWTFYLVKTFGVLWVIAWVLTRKDPDLDKVAWFGVILYLAVVGFNITQL